MQPIRLLFAATLFLLATGFTDCQWFSQVVIPAVDTSPPLAFRGVWKNGTYLTSAFDTDEFIYHLKPGESVFAVAAAIDDGGVQRLDMTSSGSYKCCQGASCTTTNLTVGKTFDERPGQVGDVVSNGLYTWRPAQLPTCPVGTSLTKYRLGWFVMARDFSGNEVALTLGASIEYP